MRIYTILKKIAQRVFAIKDYVVEEGRSGIWTYQKWNSGIAECWGQIAAPGGTTTSTEGGLYWRSFSQSLPTGLFNTTPKPIPVPKGNWIGGVVINDNTNKNAVQGYVWGSKNGNAPGQLAVILLVKGTWK